MRRSEITPIIAACTTLLVLAAALVHTGSAGVASATGNPIALLGAQLDITGCASAPQVHGAGIEVFCEDFSAVVVAKTVRVVRLRAVETSVVRAFAGVLPQALVWHEPIRTVAEALGRPRRITPMYGPPTLVYMFRDQPYGSLELLFDAREELVGINASITR